MHNLSNIRKHLHKGYRMVYMPDHPHAWRSGVVYLHRLIMENELGRYLECSEHVHHKNGDVLNNYVENLELLTCGEHAKRHRPGPKPTVCLVCNIVFTPERVSVKCCSPKCSAIARRTVSRPSREELLSEVWRKPSTAIAIELGVSDRTIKKWCDTYGIKKPPRGYWSKLRAYQTNA